MKHCLQCNISFVSPQWVCPKCTFSPSNENGVYCFAPNLAEKSEGYDPCRYEIINQFENEYFWFRGRNELICSQLKKYFPAASTLLEIGCGTGQVLNAMQSAMPTTRFCGTEIHTQGLAYARDRLSNINLLQMDARAIPFNEEFDVVCAFDVIEHVDEDCDVLRQMYQACRPGGGIVVTVPQHRWLWSHKDEVACHKRRYTRRELQVKVREAGFDVIDSTSFVTLLLPLMYLSRLRQRTPDNNELYSEFRISSLTNKIFFACSKIENTIIQMGASFPFGGSLILIAKRPMQ